MCCKTVRPHIVQENEIAGLDLHQHSLAAKKIPAKTAGTGQIRWNQWPLLRQTRWIEHSDREGPVFRRERSPSRQLSAGMGGCDMSPARGLGVFHPGDHEAVLRCNGATELGLDFEFTREQIRCSNAQCASIFLEGHIIVVRITVDRQATADIDCRNRLPARGAVDVSGKILHQNDALDHSL